MKFRLHELEDELPKIPIIIGIILDDLTILSSKKAKDHGDVLYQSGRISYNKNILQKWRYNTKNRIVYWWPLDELPREIDKESVDYHIEDKYNLPVVRHEMISGRNNEEYNKQYAKAHGYLAENEVMTEIKKLIMECIEEINNEHTN